MRGFNLSNLCQGVALPSRVETASATLPLDISPSALNLARPDSARAMQYLSMQITLLHNITVHKTQCTNSCTSQICRSWTSKTTNTNDQDLAVLQPDLACSGSVAICVCSNVGKYEEDDLVQRTLKSNLRQNHLSSVALILIQTQRPARRSRCYGLLAVESLVLTSFRLCKLLL